MELWLLGAGAVILIALTLWIVWPAQSVEASGAFRDEEDVLMRPQGDEFEDQYTSATADLSAGGVATALDAMQTEGETRTAQPGPGPYAVAGEPWSSPTIAREGTPEVAALAGPPPSPESGRWLAQLPRVGIGALILVTVVGATWGAWWAVRWRRRRNASVNRVRRSLRDVAKQFRSSRFADRVRG
jgi:hypothetical protein